MATSRLTRPLKSGGLFPTRFGRGISTHRSQRSPGPQVPKIAGRRSPNTSSPGSGVQVENLAWSIGISTTIIYRDVANLEQAGVIHLDRGLVRTVATSLSKADAEFRLQQSRG